MTRLDDLLTDASTRNEVSEKYNLLLTAFREASNQMPTVYMERRELTFHDHVKLPSFICEAVRHETGAVLEIGVWKGFSLALMQEFCEPGTPIIGIDPLELPGQAKELQYFKSKLFDSVLILHGYSESSFLPILSNKYEFKLLHIDGGHLTKHVCSDFLIYSHFVKSGGYIVFDDYGDSQHSPEVGPAVDMMATNGLFSNYHILGTVRGFENSFIIRKK